MFMNMTAKFNDSGAKALLLQNLPLDSVLDIHLEIKSNEKNINRNKQKDDKSLNKSKCSDDFSETTYNVNSLSENLRSITTKSSSNTNSEKSLPKLNFKDSSIKNIIKGKFFF